MALLSSSTRNGRIDNIPKISCRVQAYMLAIPDYDRVSLFGHDIHSSYTGEPQEQQ